MTTLWSWVVAQAPWAEAWPEMVEGLPVPGACKTEQSGHFLKEAAEAGWVLGTGRPSQGRRQEGGLCGEDQGGGW